MSIYRLLSSYQVTSICGEKGSGKSFLATELAIGLAEYKGYRLRFNFPIDEKQLYKYAISCRYWGLYYAIQNNDWGDCYSSLKLEDFLDCDRGTIFVIDEASTLGLNSRNWRDLTMEALGRFAWSRKYRSHIIWTSQHYEDVDLQIRRQTELVIHAGGYRVYDENLDLPELRQKRYECYLRRDYEVLLSRNLLESNNFKHQTMRKSKCKFTYKAPLDYFDKKLFNIFASDYVPERPSSDGFNPQIPVFNRLKCNQKKIDEEKEKLETAFKSPAARPKFKLIDEDSDNQNNQ